MLFLISKCWKINKYVLCAATIRLRGGTSKYTGEVEVFHSGTWGTVCNNNVFGVTNAEVICRSLGFRFVFLSVAFKMNIIRYPLIRAIIVTTNIVTLSEYAGVS